MDNELSSHEFSYRLSRAITKEFPDLVREFAEDLEAILAVGSSKSRRDNLVRQAFMLAQDAEDYIDGLMERLERAENVADLHDERLTPTYRLDPRGDYVYVLRDDTGPIYVGSSSNVMSRIGTHMEDQGKRSATEMVEIIRCPDRTNMLDTERFLIQKYRPPLNILGNPDARQ